MTPQEISLEEILKTASAIMGQFSPLMYIAILGIFLNILLRFIHNIFTPFGYTGHDSTSDPRNYYLREFDDLAKKIKTLSPSESLIRSLPIYRQSLENISALNTDNTNNASAQILEMVGDIHKKLVEAKGIRVISKNKSTLEDLTEELAKLDDTLSALVEVKL